MRKRKLKPLTEADDKAAWSKLPKRPARRSEAVTHFDYDSADANPNETDSGSDEPTHRREEVESWLQGCALTELQQRVILLKFFEQKSTREIGEQVSRSKAWVSKTMKIPAVRACFRALLSRQPLHPISKHHAATREENGWSLAEAINYAKQQLAMYIKGKDAGWIALGLKSILPEPHSTYAENLAAFIRLNPQALIDDREGTLTAALAQLIEAANFGHLEHRVPGLLPTNRTQAASVARAALKLLTERPRGNAYQSPASFWRALLASFNSRLCHCKGNGK
jgi:hypothetical protein